MEGISWFVAFAAGMASLLSPCVVPLIPSYLTAMAGTNLTTVQSVAEVRGRVVTNAVAFVLGFSLILVLSGMAATQLGLFVRSHQRVIAEVGGLVIILFALQVLGIINIGFLNREERVQVQSGQARRMAGSFLLGIAFAAGWTPCVGPVWASILVIAAQAHSVALGGLLLLAYAMGMALPLLLLAVFIGQAMTAVRHIQRYLPAVERATGLLLLVLGLALVTGIYGSIPNYLYRF
ncbi:DsbD domain-containing protein [Candidatus Hydrogenisulfobacillus filiaventi]|uniref:DsbD domain-containing protein n=1 Tax=Candidatus Hydrogenisulfobacillus filiaventi TaxID=2707344 RepID=A0A6F8ZH90_9FIRM|nr:sulfite exporter TauE/SafE family protein [Bacillota bacterium]CAB1129022.1 DsbD domain-containing protein [Candidatus Hydrogenisulfobacillus filiaventi]